MSDALPEPEVHVAAGDGWVLSRGRGAGQLLVHVANADVTALRRCLAVAGSVGVRHLAAVVDAVGSGDGSVTVAVAPPRGPSLAELSGTRGRLPAGEVVTLVSPLAATLGALHARGVGLGAVTQQTVWLAEDGRPVLLPVLLAERHDAGADLVALAEVGAAVLDRASSGAVGVAAALSAAAEGHIDAAELSGALLRATKALPIATTTPAPVVGHGTRRRRARSVFAIVAVTTVAAAIGTGLGRQGGNDTVLAAPPAARLTAHSPAAPSWSSVMTQLEHSRARAYATGNVTLLDEVYAPSSSEGAADRRLLGRMIARGLRAVGLEAFVEAVRVVTATGARVSLRVTDALTSYDVIGRHGLLIRHGQGRPSRQWSVELVRTSAGWRIWSVRSA